MMNVVNINFEEEKINNKMIRFILQKLLELEIRQFLMVLLDSFWSIQVITEQNALLIVLELHTDDEDTAKDDGSKALRYLQDNFAQNKVEVARIIEGSHYYRITYRITL